MPRIAVIPGDGIGLEVVREAVDFSLLEPVHRSAPDIPDTGAPDLLGAVSGGAPWPDYFERTGVVRLAEERPLPNREGP